MYHYSAYSRVLAKHATANQHLNWSCTISLDTLACVMHPCALAEFVGCSLSLSGAIRVNSS
jgi:hypothetical protein